MKHCFVHIAIVLLLLCPTVSAQQQRNDSLEFAKLRKEMYNHFSKRNTDDFFSVTDKQKQLAQKTGNEKEFYKAWANQAIYTSMNINKGKGIDIAKEILRYANQQASQYGLSSANYVMGTVYSSLSFLPEASSHYQEALDILRSDYPEESRSALNLAMCKVARALKQYDKVDGYVSYVLNDPKATMHHKLTALSYKYLVQRDRKAPLAEFDKTYAEREQLKQRYGQDDNFGPHIDFEHALLHDDFEKARQVAEGIPSKNKITQLQYLSRLGVAQQDYKKAYEYYVRYKRLNDSVNNNNVRKNSLDLGAMLDKANAENELKDLRLQNQELEMKRIASELKQKNMAEEALSMSLAYQESRLREMEALRENDSLMADNKAHELNEYRSKMHAFETAERNRRLKWIAALVFTAMGFAFVVIYALNRRKQLRRLKDAYDRLEETTAAKERIESELRIAREIQMAMVPHDFPQTQRLDIYASMTPAKEVGGDLYDFVAIDDKLYFCLGDVSGKGVPAALFMAMAARLFRTLCKYRLSPALIATSMNNELALNNENGMFVTMFIGLLDLNSGHLDFCNAGHNPPVLDGEFIEMEANAPLGLWEGLDYEGQSLDSIKGKQLFVYSDGLNEAENDTHDQYSDDRLLAFIRSHHQMEARPMIDLLMQDVESHVNGADPSDDLTMLCLRKK